MSRTYGFFWQGDLIIKRLGKQVNFISGSEGREFFDYRLAYYPRNMRHPSKGGRKCGCKKRFNTLLNKRRRVYFDKMICLDVSDQSYFLPTTKTKGLNI